MANLIRVEQVPGQDREIRYFDAGTTGEITNFRLFYDKTLIQITNTVNLN